MKTCIKCLESKSKNNFTKRTKNSVDGFRNTCKCCDNARKLDWSKQNPDAKYKASHKYLDKIKDTQSYKDSTRLKNQKALKENPEYFYVKQVERRAKKLQATPKWDAEFTEFVCKEAYQLAKLRKKTTNISWHVDHIVPLSGRSWCGLHTWSNFQVIPASLNVRKCNVNTNIYRWSDYF